jgi:hypothetical protein
VQQLADDGQDAVEVPGRLAPSRTSPTGPALTRDQRRAVGVDDVRRGVKTTSAPLALADREVVGERAG